MYKDKEKQRAYQRTYHKTHPRDRCVYMKEWRSENPDRVLANTRKWKAKYHAKWKRYHVYAISEDAYQKMLITQAGCCAICGDNPRSLCTDHDHKTNEVRGLLCNACNTGIGLLKDNVIILQQAIDYLKRSELGSSLSRSKVGREA